MSKIRVAVLFGGTSNEHDVSLVSAAAVAANLPRDKYEVACVGITRKGHWLYFPGDPSSIADGSWERDPDCAPAVLSPDPLDSGLLLNEGGELTVRKLDVVFPILPGRGGADGTIQGLLDLSRIPYIGSGLLVSACCMDKIHTHILLDSHHLRAPRWCMIGQRDMNRLEDACTDAAEALGFPVFVKPANSGSSIGTNRATDLKSLKDAVKIAFSHDNKVLVEEFIDGREISVAVIGYDAPFASYAGEIVPTHTAKTKYVRSTVGLEVPAKLEESMTKALRETALQAYKAFNCKGLARVDFFVTDDGTIYVNELNNLPGFTELSVYPKLMDQLGIPYSELLEQLIEQALDNADRTY